MKTASLRLRTLRHYESPFLIVLAALVLTGCGADKQAATQVAARINSEEITIHQLNDVLAQSPNLAGSNTEEARRVALERLIDQQLAIDQAHDLKLDRLPDVVRAMEAAKRQILAQAYLQQAIRALPKPSEREIRQYFDEHPELFTRRKVYELRGIALQASGVFNTQVEGMVSEGKSLDDIGTFLNSQNVAFKLETAIRAADQLPLESLPNLASTKPGGLTVIKSPLGMQIVMVSAARPAPIELAAASSQISQFLFNQRASEFVQKDLTRLRKLASIEYMDASLAQSPNGPVGKTAVMNAIADNAPETITPSGSIELKALTPK